MNRDEDRRVTVRGILRRIDLARFELDEAETALVDVQGRLAKKRAELARLTAALEALHEPAEPLTS